MQKQKCKYCENSADRTLIWLYDKNHNPAEIKFPWCGCDLMIALKKKWDNPTPVTEGIHYKVETKQDYVLCFAKTIYDSILYIEKQRPNWQKGRFNLIGGKIEKDETPKDAAIREFSEEAKIFNTNPKEVGLITGSWGNIYCFTIPIRRDEIIFDNYPMISDGEKVFWETWENMKDDHRLIPNLKVIIPLCISNVCGWEILDEGDSRTFRIKV